MYIIRLQTFLSIQIPFMMENNMIYEYEIINHNTISIGTYLIQLNANISNNKINRFRTTEYENMF